MTPSSLRESVIISETSPTYIFSSFDHYPTAPLESVNSETTSIISLSSSVSSLTSQKSSENSETSSISSLPSSINSIPYSSNFTPSAPRDPFILRETLSNNVTNQHQQKTLSNQRSIMPPNPNKFMDNPSSIQNYR